MPSEPKGGKPYDIKQLHRIVNEQIHCSCNDNHPSDGQPIPCRHNKQRPHDYYRFDETTRDTLLALLADFEKMREALEEAHKIVLHHCHEDEAIDELDELLGEALKGAK